MTFEEYYSTKVRDIFLNVIRELDQDPNKKFTFCETSFIKRFWEDKEVNYGVREVFRRLLKDGSIEIMGGGVVMHDEVLTNYKA